MENPLVINPKQEVEKIISFLKKTLKEQKIDKVVLGFSGGIDSTVALYLLKKVLPAKNIFAVQMDYIPRKKLDIDLKGINIVNVPIKEIVNHIESLIPNFFSGKQQTAKKLVSSLLLKDKVKSNFSLSRGPRSGETLAAIKFEEPSLLNSKVRFGNIMARVRMIILFDLAKQLGGLVCGTENKSERLLGYFTRFGDAASDIEPISHLYKTQIYQLAKYLKVSDEIINKKPSAGLWNGQTDEDDFGFTYEEADQVLNLIESHYCHSRGGGNPEHQALDPLLQGDDKKHIKDFPNAEKIIKRVQKNQFKLRTPYSLK